MEKELLITPGEILREDFLEPMGITAYRLAAATDIPQSRVSAILSGTRRITADTALRFSRYFGTTPEFWMNLQSRYDLDKARSSKAMGSIQTIAPAAQA